jgi:DNA invertase Pin-like site-specific DNA recombinase
MPRRPLHPDDARDRLRAHGTARTAHDREGSRLRKEFPKLVAECLRAGLTKEEIAKRTGVSRDTVERASPNGNKPTRTTRRSS